MTRFRIVAVLAALALASAVLSACGGGEESPQEVLDGVSFEGAESGAFAASLAVEASADRSADLAVELSGQFERRGFDLPLLDAEARVEGTAEGKEVAFQGSLTLLEDHGFVDYKGTTYEIDPTNFAFARSIFLPGSEVEGKKSNQPEIASCLRGLSGTPISELVEKPRNDGSVEVDGEETTKVSGELDAAALGDLFTDLAGDPSCRVQLEAVSPLPLYELLQIADELDGAVQEARIEVYVGDDDIVRKLVAGFAAARQGERVAVDLDLSLTDVNQPQQIEAPAKGKPLQALFFKLGVNSTEFLTASGGEVIDQLLEKVAADALP